MAEAHSHHFSRTSPGSNAMITGRPPSGIYFLHEPEKVFCDEDANLTKCSICYQDFDENIRCPRVLPCGHIICDSCVSQGVNIQGFQSIKCPLDRSTHQIIRDPCDGTDPWESEPALSSDRMPAPTTPQTIQPQQILYNMTDRTYSHRLDIANTELSSQSEHHSDISPGTAAYSSKNHLARSQPLSGIYFLEEPSDIVYLGETKCFICYVRFDDHLHIPRVLPCGHIYCDACITDIARCSDFESVTCPIDLVKHNIL